MRTYQIFVQDVDGLIAGSPVKFMGVQVGYIDRIRIVSDNIYVRLRITDKNISLPQGAIASVEFSGLGGSKSLEIYPPTVQSIASEKIIYVERTKRLNDALGLLNDMYGKIGSVVERISFFGSEAGVLASGLEKGIDTKQALNNLKIFEKWIDSAERNGMGNRKRRTD
jgi:hypothetical protein